MISCWDLCTVSVESDVEIAQKMSKRLEPNNQKPAAKIQQAKLRGRNHSFEKESGLNCMKQLCDC